MIAHCREHLAGYKMPRSVTWSPELPKTGSGKILKRELARPVLGRPRQQGLTASSARSRSVWSRRPRSGAPGYKRWVCVQECAEMAACTSASMSARLRAASVLSIPSERKMMVRSAD